MTRPEDDDTTTVLHWLATGACCWWPGGPARPCQAASRTGASSYTLQHPHREVFILIYKHPFCLFDNRNSINVKRTKKETLTVCLQMRTGCSENMPPWRDGRTSPGRRKDCRLALDRAAGTHPADSPHSRTQTRGRGDSRTDMDTARNISNWDQWSQVACSWFCALHDTDTVGHAYPWSKNPQYKNFKIVIS